MGENNSLLDGQNYIINKKFFDLQGYEIENILSNTLKTNMIHDHL